MACVLRLSVLLVLVVSPLFSQPRVSPRNLYERLLCVVPMVGAGTDADPRRPMFAPLPPAPGEQPPSGAAKRQDIETEFRKYKRNFSLDQLGVSLP